jgi:signal transduction histidine kinase
MNEEAHAYLDLINEQKKEIQAALEQLNEQKKLIEIQNKELEERNQALKESNLAKDKFFSIIGHDLKNPISAIIGFSKLIKNNAETYDSRKIANFAGIIENSSSNVHQLLENLLSWASCQTGRLLFAPEQANLESLIDAAIRTHQDAAEKKEIALLNANSYTGNVFCDANMVETILRNLIGNAIKFTPKGGSVSVNTQQQEKNVVIRIVDTGVGMSEAALSNIFILGEQMTTRGTEREAGTGIGLLLCKEFAAAHGSKIEVESQLGKGSTFAFALKREEL